MFVGHFGVGFGAKAAAKTVSLGTLFLAAQFIDLLWPTLLLLGIERVRIEPGITTVTPLNFLYYPFSHSLLFVLIWAAVVGGAFYLIRKSMRGALVLGVLVVSHWLLDLIVHRPDLPLYPGSTTLAGWEGWSSLGTTLVLEGGIFAAGVFLYFRATEAADLQGVWGLWTFVAVIVGIYLLNVFGPPPPDVSSIAWAGHLQWLFVVWGYWVDRHRRPVFHR
ncbi:MAG: metal-dependent hydrolase [Acidobacteriota bacterium]